MLNALESYLPEGCERLDVLVSSAAGRRDTKTVLAHLCTTALPTGSFIPTDAMGIEFHVCAPELVFLQMAGEVEFDHLVYIGFALCSAFRLDSWEPGGCVHREGYDAPLTTIDRLRAYLERLPEGTRNRAVALRVCLVKSCFRKRASLSFGFRHASFSVFGAGTPLAS